MSKKFIMMVIALLAFVASVPGQAQNLSLEIDGQVVAGPGELTSVEYSPTGQRLEVVTIFEDVRCVPGGASGPTGNSRLVIDQINPAVESGAEYGIALPANGGSIELDSANGVLRVTTSNVVGEQLDCVRQRSAFWASDFEDVFSVTAATPASPFPTGNTLNIPFTVKNETLTTIATDIVVDFTWSATDPLGQPVAAVDPPAFIPSTGVTSLTGGDRRWTIDILWPGESRTITVSYQLDAVPPETLITTEVFNVEASDREGVDAISVGSPAPVVSEVTTGEADLTISKTQTAGPDPVTAAGQVLEYDVVIANTGTFSLTGVVVTDTYPNGNEEILTNPVESITPDGELEPGENWTFSASYTVEQSDIDAGFAGDPIVNTASVETVEVPGPSSDTAMTTVDAQRTQNVTFSTTAASANAAGQIIPYQLEIENTGQVSITVSSVSATLPDNSSASLTGPNESFQPPTGKIEPGEIWTYDTEYSVTQADLDTKTNLTGVSSASTSVASGVLRFAEVPVDKVSAIELTKRITANQTYDSVGDVIDYAFDIENTGTQTLSGPVSVSDQLIASVTCPADLSQVGNGDSDLQPGEIAVCTASITVDQGHLDAGSIVNTATATVDGVTSAQAMATANAIQTPEITLTKSVSSITVVNTGTVVSTYENVGDVINYEFNVQNSGNQTLAGPVSVSDDMTNDETCPSLTGIGDNDSDFDPGESIVCTASYTVDQPDIDNGSVVNEATATAGSTTSNLSTATANATQNNAMIVEASGTVDMGTNGTLEAGDTIDYSFTIQNLGNTTLTDLSISPNDPDVTITGMLGSLAPGVTDAATFSGTYVIESGDISAGSFGVIFTASSNEGASDNVSETTAL